VFKAHRLLYHSTLGLRVITKEEKRDSTVTDSVRLLVTPCHSQDLRTTTSHKCAAVPRRARI